MCGGGRRVSVWVWFIMKCIQNVHAIFLLLKKIRWKEKRIHCRVKFIIVKNVKLLTLTFISRFFWEEKPFWHCPREWISLWRTKVSMTEEKTLISQYSCPLNLSPRLFECKANVLSNLATAILYFQVYSKQRICCLKNLQVSNSHSQVRGFHPFFTQYFIIPSLQLITLSRNTFCPDFSKLVKGSDINNKMVVKANKINLSWKKRQYTKHQNWKRNKY